MRIPKLFNPSSALANSSHGRVSNEGGREGGKLVKLGWALPLTGVTLTCSAAELKSFSQGGESPYSQLGAPRIPSSDWMNWRRKHKRQRL